MRPSGLLALIRTSIDVPGDGTRNGRHRACGVARNNSVGVLAHGKTHIVGTDLAHTFVVVCAGVIVVAIVKIDIADSKHCGRR